MKLQIQTQKLQSCYILPLFVEEKKTAAQSQKQSQSVHKSTETKYSNTLYQELLFAWVFVCVIVYLHVHAIVLDAI